MATETRQERLSHPFKTEAVQAAAAAEQTVESSPALTWLTLETLLYGVIIVVAVALRLADLGSYPLSNAEAEQSLAALSLYQGSLPESGQYSPLLISVNTLAFWLFGPHDGSARLASVLLGTGLVLLPMTLRRQWGPLVCLLTSALLAISPAAVFLSRTLNSEVAVATASLMMVSGFFNWAEDGRQRWLLLLAGGLALLLVAGPLAYSVLIVFGLIVLVRFSTFKALWTTGLAQTGIQVPANQTTPKLTDDGASPVSPEGSLQEQSDEDGQADDQDSAAIDPNLRTAGIFFAVTLILLATTFTLNFSGFGIATTFFVDWLSNFGFQTEPNAGFNAIFLLTIYEPLILFAGLTGIALAILRRDPMQVLFVAWFGGLLLLDLFMSGRPNGSLILPLVPLAFLAAAALAELWEGLRRWGTWSNEGILLATGLVIAGFAYIGLTSWLIRTCGPEDTVCQYSWVQAVAAVALFLVVVIFFAVMAEPSSALRGMALTGVAVGLLATINIGWRLNYGPLMHLGYQPLAGIPASTELVQLTETLAQQAERRVGDAELLDTTLVGPASPALRWQLRDYSHLTQASSTLAAPQATAVITPAANQELGASEPYIGQDFTLDAVWSPVGLPPKEFISWLIYRQVEERPQGNRAILWLRLDES